jgi:hypothetical protein
VRVALVQACVLRVRDAARLHPADVIAKTERPTACETRGLRVVSAPEGWRDNATRACAPRQF